MSGGAEHIDDLVSIHRFHSVASRSEVFSRVEFGRFLCEDLADAGCHCETGVGVDIDLADSGLRGFAELFLRNADGCLESSAVFVDDVNFFLRNGRCAVKNDREARQFFFDRLEDIECQRRRNQFASLGIDGALFRSDVPMEIARESTPVLVTKSTTCSGFV